MIWGRDKYPEQSLSAAQPPPVHNLSLSVRNPRPTDHVQADIALALKRTECRV